MLSLLFIFLAYSLTSCGNEPSPNPNDNKLPWGVFPLKDVRWVEQVWGQNAYNWDQWIYDTVTYSVHQIAENKAELYKYTDRTVLEMWPAHNKVDTSYSIGPELIGWISIENNKVFFTEEYVYPPYLEKPSTFHKGLFYDFNLQLGDTLFGKLWDDNYENAWPLVVSLIDSVKIDNEYRKRFHYKALLDLGDLWNFAAIEGIGCMDRHLFFPFQGDNSHVDPVRYYRLLGVYYKDKLIYPLSTGE